MQRGRRIGSQSSESGGGSIWFSPEASVSGLEEECSKVIALSFRYSWPSEGPLLSVAIIVKIGCHSIFAFYHPLPAPNLPGLPQTTLARLGCGQVCVRGVLCLGGQELREKQSLTTAAPHGRCTRLDLLQVVFFVIICCCFKKILKKKKSVMHSVVISVGGFVQNWIRRYPEGYVGRWGWGEQSLLSIQKGFQILFLLQG